MPAFLRARKLELFQKRTFSPQLLLRSDCHWLRSSNSSVLFLVVLPLLAALGAGCSSPASTCYCCVAVVDFVQPQLSLVRSFVRSFTHALTINTLFTRTQLDLSSSSSCPGGQAHSCLSLTTHPLIASMSLCSRWTPCDVPNKHNVC